ncbi:MAG: AAA family ATPase, partial [Thermoplasmata archaeon]|nr:AAA family ATPase [Thermoplasmata archaeon]
MERFKEGLIIGKFMPIHAGHQHLIDTGKARVERLTVLVCSHYWEPIPGEKRYEWVKEMNPDVNVVWVNEELPSQPEEHPDFWDIWRRAILKYAPKPDAIFSSEDYGYKLAEVLGCVHVCVDPRRERYHISGEKVRADPYKWWDFIPPPVKAYYVKRVCIVGPESTGKTTLAAALAERLRTVWVPEYAVEYLKNGNDDLRSTDDIERIAMGQIESEDAAARQANRILICDTDLMTTAIWSDHYFRSCPTWIVEESCARKYDLFLLTDIDIPWIESRWRDCPDKREQFRRLFIRELTLRGRRYAIISGSEPEKRLEAAISHIATVFPDGMN